MSGATAPRRGNAARRFALGSLGPALGLLSALAAALFVLGCVLGTESIDLATAISDRGSMDGRILFGLRLPRLFLAAITGAGLAAAGAAYQGLLRNPLADPFILGVSGGAALGGTMVLVLGAALLPSLGGGTVGAGAFAGATLATFLTAAAGKRGGQLDPVRTLLAGVVFNGFAASLITVSKTVVSPDKAQELLFWLTGSVGYEAWPTLAAACGVISLSIAVLFSQGYGLNLASLGEDQAASLGVDVGRLRTTVFLAASLTVGVAVSLTGLLAFVGLVVPHLLRLAFGPDYRMLIPASALGGASFLLAADLGTRLLFGWLGTELPAGALTALVGGPFFLLLLHREERQVV